MHSQQSPTQVGSTAFCTRLITFVSRQQVGSREESILFIQMQTMTRLHLFDEVLSSPSLGKKNKSKSGHKSGQLKQITVNMSECKSQRV